LFGLKEIFEEEHWEDHKDVFISGSLVKLFVGSYTGTIQVIDKNTLEVVLYNRTTLNSLALHRGTDLQDRGIMTVEDYNKSLRPLFRPTEQVFRFRINIDEWKQK